MKKTTMTIHGLIGTLLSLPAAAAETQAQLTEPVRATEIAFAKTLANRDVAAFTRMIAPDGD